MQTKSNLETVYLKKKKKKTHEERLFGHPAVASLNITFTCLLFSLLNWEMSGREINQLL